MSKNITKRNEEKLKVYLQKNGIDPKSGNKTAGNAGTCPQADKSLFHRKH